MFMWTLWEFRSPSSPEVRRVMRSYSIEDRQVVHEYQRILWQGSADSAMKAWYASGFKETVSA